MARGNGKTTRQIQKAIERAREGVPVLCITRGPPSYYIGLAHSLAPDGVMMGARCEMLVPHGSSIRFVEDAGVRGDYVQGWRGVAVVDHAASLSHSQWMLLQHPNIEIDGSVPAANAEVPPRPDKARDGLGASEAPE